MAQTKRPHMAYSPRWSMVITQAREECLFSRVSGGAGWLYALRFDRRIMELDQAQWPRLGRLLTIAKYAFAATAPFPQGHLNKLERCARKPLQTLPELSFASA